MFLYISMALWKSLAYFNIHVICCFYLIASIVREFQNVPSFLCHVNKTNGGIEFKSRVELVACYLLLCALLCCRKARKDKIQKQILGMRNIPVKRRIRRM